MKSSQVLSGQALVGEDRAPQVDIVIEKGLIAAVEENLPGPPGLDLPGFF